MYELAAALDIAHRLRGDDTGASGYISKQTAVISSGYKSFRETHLHVLADTAQFVFSLPLNLRHQILLQLPRAPPVVSPLSQEQVVPPLGLPPLVLLFVGVLHGGNKRLPVLLLVIAVSGVSKHGDPEVAEGHLSEPDHHPQTADDALEDEDVGGAEEPEGGAEDEGPGDVPLPHDAEDEVGGQAGDEDAGGQPQQHLGGGGPQAEVETCQPESAGLGGLGDELTSGEVEEVEGPGHEVHQQHQAAPHQTEELPALVNTSTEAGDEQRHGGGETVDCPRHIITGSAHQAAQPVHQHVETIQDEKPGIGHGLRHLREEHKQVF